MGLKNGIQSIKFISEVNFDLAWPYLEGFGHRN